MKDYVLPEKEIVARTIKILTDWGDTKESATKQGENIVQLIKDLSKHEDVSQESMFIKVCGRNFLR